MSGTVIKARKIHLLFTLRAAAIVRVVVIEHMHPSLRHMAGIQGEVMLRLEGFARPAAVRNTSLDILPLTDGRDY